ncbi:MAG: nucleoside triphosphate pyrophosphohydrolase [Bacteroidota bacterium]
MKERKTDKLFSEYMAVVRRLRKECPWDREQTHQSIRQSLIEEAYEVVEAIDENDLGELKKELGDLLLHVALHAVMAEEKKAFDMDSVLQSSMEKLIRRHPHVFGGIAVENAREVKVNWEKIKMSEGRNSLMEGVPKELPSLLRAHRLQEKASKVGFDWKEKGPVWEKVREEIDELQQAEHNGRVDETEEEFGDLLFALVNYSRFLNINPENALRRSTEKFIRRFRALEQELVGRGKRVEDSTPEEMDELWNAGKKAGKNS